MALDFLPTCRAEMDALGWDMPDVILVSGDAYIDHPAFAAGVLGRVLESKGFRVAVLAQPDWRSATPWRDMGPPRLFYGVTAGNMDSMINHYTASRKRRNDDAYSPGGAIGLRPDRPTPIYAQRCREAFSGMPVVIGGVEASLRRIAHYDYWSQTVRPSMLVSSKADLLVFGMGEGPIVEIAERLREGAHVRELRDMRSVCYLLGRKEDLPEHDFPAPGGDRATRMLPSYEEVKADKQAFVEMTARHHYETNPFNARRIVQPHGDRRLVQNPPWLPLDEAAMDAIYDLPYQRRAHPAYEAPIPAERMIRDSVTIMRGCFGGCTFCSITMHQGRTIQNRSERSILNEVERIAGDEEFRGTISDLGGPTANMYRMRCTRPEVEVTCRRLSCVHPKICPLLGTSHEPTIDLMKAARETPGVKQVNVASGIRMDLANRSTAYIDELVQHHVGGHLKVAPEHTDADVLRAMKKPPQASFEEFEKAFAASSRRAGKEQYLVPYFISSHPASDVDAMIDLAVFLRQRGYKPRQVQDFIPAPMDLATCMYYTGIDPVSRKPVYTAQHLRDRRVQRALLQYFRPENWFVVHRALRERGRDDLIGTGRLCLIPPNPPREALEARRRGANESPAPVHAEEAGTRPTVGYRPHRKGARGRRRKPKRN